MNKRLAVGVVAAALTLTAAAGITTTAHAEDKAPVQGQFCPDSKKGQTGTTADGDTVICKVGNAKQEQWLAYDQTAAKPSTAPTRTLASTGV